MMEETEIIEIINNLIKKAHIHKDLKEDLFQELYLYYLQLKRRYLPETKVPFKAFIIKFLTWKMWAVVSRNTDLPIENIESLVDSRDEESLCIIEKDFSEFLIRGL